jgi:glycosyltransferase involved in cell wall biosynthesis
MKISIAICTFNGEKYLSQQLESFANQTRLPDELVVGDDCSTDKTLAILEEFAVKSPFPVHIHKNKNNLGLVRNFDETIGRCSGDLIFLSDQDDVWIPTKIEKIAVEFERFPQVGLVFCNAELVDEKLSPLNSTLFDRVFPFAEQLKAKNEKIIDVLVNKNVVAGSASAFRAKYRKFFSPIPTDFSLIHDGWIAFLLASISEVRFLEEPLLKYRQHSEQATRLIWKYNEKTKIQRISRLETSNQGLRYYKEREKDLTFLLETICKVEKELAANEFVKKAINDIQRHISLSKQAGEHFNVRKNLPSLRLGRFYQVGKEVMKGRYHKYSNGFASAFKDLIYK